MLSVSSLIEFLLNLLRDEAAQEEFERDPEGTLARHGLDGLSGQDVRDAAPLVADHRAVHVRHGGSDQPAYHGDDPVRAITHITERYEVTNVVVDDSDEYNFIYVDDRDTTINVDDRDTIVTVDDRDTTTIDAEGDVTIEDSFNQDNDVAVIEDSFNQDNDGVDNKGGTIEDSTVAGDDIEDSLNSDDDTTVVDSLNEDNSATADASDDDTTDVGAQDSYNEDNDSADIDVAEESLV
ncbi:MAG: IniB N-terminal domain-containing protein [Pseudonocardiaceae bacterium]